jgi:hypothetical protein
MLDLRDARKQAKGAASQTAAVLDLRVSSRMEAVA